MGAHTVLLAKEHVHYFDKVKKDRLSEEIGRHVGRSGQDVKRWFESQRTRYGKLTRDQAKSGSGRKFQKTERTKWVLKNFAFLEGHIMRRAAVETGGFSQISSVTATSPNKSKGSLTDVDSIAESGSQGQSQHPSFASATVSTPAQSAQSAPPHDPAMVDIYSFLKEKNEARRERQSFYDFFRGRGRQVTVQQVRLLPG